jgi:hypothetical protein
MRTVGEAACERHRSAETAKDGWEEAHLTLTTAIRRFRSLMRGTHGIRRVVLQEGRQGRFQRSLHAPGLTVDRQDPNEKNSLVRGLRAPYLKCPSPEPAVAQEQDEEKRAATRGARAVLGLKSLESFPGRSLHEVCTPSEEHWEDGWASDFRCLVGRAWDGLTGRLWIYKAGFAAVFLGAACSLHGTMWRGRTR